MTINVAVNLSFQPDDPLVVAMNQVGAKLDGIRGQLASGDSSAADLETAIAALRDLKARFDQIDSNPEKYS